MKDDFDDSQLYGISETILTVGFLIKKQAHNNQYQLGSL